MRQTFYFYDLETSGFRAATDRIMQFAGQRTSLDLEPIGEPHNMLIKLNPDILPSPEATLVHGITPQQASADGYSEAEFLKLFRQDIAIKGTIFVGFNSVRFDDEFIRYLHYRNLYDAYTWQWEDGKSRWDLLDLTRMTRSLRPDGIKWPFDSEGRPANRLELLTAINRIEHNQAHDALADVRATIEIAQLLQKKQPNLFKFLLEHRDKKKVRQLVLSGQPYIYTSGKYASQFEKTTVVHTIAEHPDGHGAALVFDIRFDPTPYFSMNKEQLAASWQLDWDDPKRLPVKTLKYNRCPAIAPLSVLDVASQKRLDLNPKTFMKHHKLLMSNSDFAYTLQATVTRMDKERQQRLIETETDVDTRLYEDFFDNHDKKLTNDVHQTDPKHISSKAFAFHDQRLTALLPLYKARNYPKSLTDEEEKWWQAHIERKLVAGADKSNLAQFLVRIEELKTTVKNKRDRYLLEELELFGHSLLPADGLDR